MLQSMGLQRVGRDLATEQQQRLLLAELLRKLEKKNGEILIIVPRIQWAFNKVYHIGWEVHDFYLKKEKKKDYKLNMTTFMLNFVISIGEDHI